jgi:hypothetical protein
MAFYNWAIANGWQRGLTIDRIDNNGNYSPENCRFVSRTINQRNSRRCKLTEEEVRSMRDEFNEGARICDMAKQFGIEWDVAYKIKNRITWKGIEP